MASLNKVILIGNATRDTEVKYTPGGMAIAAVGMAINRKWKDAKTNEAKEDVCFVDIEMWGKQAEVAGQYLKKGANFMVEGRLKTDQWDDKQTGQKRSKLKVVAERMQFVGAKAPGTAPATAAPAKPAGQPVAAPAQEVPTADFDGSTPF